MGRVIEETKVKAGVTLDLKKMSVREINQLLHTPTAEVQAGPVVITHSGGAHNLAVGLKEALNVVIRGHAGYYAAGMNKLADIVVEGNVERGVAENMMSGSVRVNGNASECAGASARGGLLVIEGNASGRCGISLKGADIVVGGSVGHLSAFMAQAGRMVVLGDAGAGLGDSLYEAVIYVRGKLHGLGADAREEAMTEADYAVVEDLLAKAQLPGKKADPKSFKRVASGRTLYHWNSEAHQEY
jgi:methylamine---glutamate N-methyltransferase subunit B